MNPPWLPAFVDDGLQLDRLSAWLGSWDAGFWIQRPPRDALLYEPDATLYGVGLGARMAVRLNHRERVLALGDLIVVPPGLALDFEPEVDLLAVCCAGAMPDHFRERYIQVWGYDHLPARITGLADSSRLIPVIEPKDLRYRLSYSVAELAGGLEPIPIRSDGLDLSLVVHMEGTPVIAIPEQAREIDLAPGQLIGIEPGLGFHLKGSGRAGLFRLVSDGAFYARRALRESGWESPAVRDGSLAS